LGALSPARLLIWEESSQHRRLFFFQPSQLAGLAVWPTSVCAGVPLACFLAVSIRPFIGLPGLHPQLTSSFLTLPVPAFTATSHRVVRVCQASHQAITIPLLVTPSTGRGSIAH
jgi:hypothetical protein